MWYLKYHSSVDLIIKLINKSAKNVFVLVYVSCLWGKIKKNYNKKWKCRVVITGDTTIYEYEWFLLGATCIRSKDGTGKEVPWTERRKSEGYSRTRGVRRKGYSLGATGPRSGTPSQSRGTGEVSNRQLNLSKFHPPRNRPAFRFSNVTQFSTSDLP